MSENTIKLELERWKGYSAYEVAKNNGFNGTEKEWLEQLGTNTNITVNGQVVNEHGDIVVTGERMTVLDEGTTTVAQRFREMEEEKISKDDLVQDVSSGETDKAVSAAGAKLIKKQAAQKAEVYVQSVTLPLSAWEQDGEIYGQSVLVNYITIDKNKTSAIVSPPTDREKEEMYTDAQVRAAAQGDGVLVFTCADLPDADLEANVMVVVRGEEV